MSAAARLGAMTEGEAREALTRCCGATRWVEGMLKRRPFASDAALTQAAAQEWARMTRGDILEAFAQHPRIGERLDFLRQQLASTADWSAGEQSAVGRASESTLTALHDRNLRYEEKFGHIFIVCASGKSAAEMLALLEARLGNDPEAELAIAAAEQAKITKLRLEKL
jgi:2-oxo-4-hydroxy-4-carboxy-5-ureidoimidazoline decarboxylase